MEQVMGRLLYGKVLNELLGEFNELNDKITLLKVEYPKAFWTLEAALLDAHEHREHCKPFFDKQLPLEREEGKRDKEELAYLRKEVINLEEEIVKLKAVAKRKRLKAKK